MVWATPSFTAARGYFGREPFSLSWANKIPSATKETRAIFFSTRARFLYVANCILRTQCCLHVVVTQFKEVDSLLQHEQRTTRSSRRNADTDNQGWKIGAINQSGPRSADGPSTCANTKRKKKHCRIFDHSSKTQTRRQVLHLPFLAPRPFILSLLPPSPNEPLLLFLRG